MRRIIVPVLLVLLLGGCAATQLVKDTAETPAQKHYAVLEIFRTYDNTALQIAQNPTTPSSVAKNLKRVRMVARAALDVMEEAYQQYNVAKQVLDTNPTNTALEDAQIRLEIFNERRDMAFDKVDALKNAVDALF